MIARVLRNTELAPMADLVSPALWKVVSWRELWTAMRQLLSNNRDRRRFAELVTTLQGGKLKLVDGKAGQSILDLADDVALARVAGEALLELFFRQILTRDTVLLDLRPQRLGLEGEALCWWPKRYYFRWSEAVGAGLRGLYEGFYGEREELFVASLAALSLTPAEAVFRRHFQSTTAQRFEVSALMETLNEVFEVCAAAKVKLSGEFVAFGFYLTALYQSLEALGAMLDVRRCYARVATLSSPS